MATDTGGLPHGNYLSTASMGERDGARHLIARAWPHLSGVRKLLVDGGYSGPEFAEELKWLVGAELEVAKRNELHTFKVIPKRWVVERSFAWLDKCRRLWKNCERKLHTTLRMIALAFISVLLKRY